jgi:predicted nucleic acid-binding protein
VAGYVVLDTDVASHLQRRTLAEHLRRQLSSRTLCVTFVTVGEFYKGAYKRNWSPERLAKMTEWLRRLLVLPYDAGVARAWGRLVADREREGRPVPVNDAWIAACCISRDLPLITLNRSHFDGIPGLTLIP